MSLDDMRPNFDGNIDIQFPPTMAIFISPGYLTDYAWLKIADSDFAAAVLAAGRTVGHPAQAAEGVGEEKYVPLYNPFIIGKKARNADHVHRFRDIKKARDEKTAKTGAATLETYLINTTGRIGGEYEIKDDNAAPKFEFKNGKKKPLGGEGPSIKETELFLIQEARGVVKYEPHPIWGEKILVPVDVPGIPKKRLDEFNPFNFRSSEDMLKMLQIQLRKTKALFDKELEGLDEKIYHAMDIKTK